MKPIHSSINSGSRTFCMSTGELAVPCLQVEGNNKETFNLRKRYPLKSKQKKIKTIENLVEKSKGSLSTDNFQGTEYSVNPGQSDAIEKSSAVLDLVNFVDKVAVLGPNRLGESCSCTTSAILRQYEHNKKRNKRNSYNNACIRQRCGSNFTMSKKRSCLLRTILNTKFSQSTPSQCTFNFKNSEGNHSKIKTNYISAHCEKQKEDCDITRKRNGQSNFVPTSNEILLVKSSHDQTRQSNTMPNNFRFSKLGSKSKESMAGLVSSDLSSKIYISDQTKNASWECFEKPKDLLPNYEEHICRTAKNDNLNSANFESSLNSSSVVNKTWKLNNKNIVNELNDLDANKERQSYGEWHSGKEMIAPYHCLKKGRENYTRAHRLNSDEINLQKETIIPKNFEDYTKHDRSEFNDDSKTTLEADSCLSASNMSRKLENQVHKCEVHWDYCPTNEKYHINVKSSANLSTSSSASKEATYAKRKRKINKRSAALRDYWPEKVKAMTDLISPSGYTLTHIDRRTVKNNTFLKEKPKKQFKREIEPIIRNDRIKNFETEQRTLKFTNMDCESRANTIKKQIMTPDTKPLPFKQIVNEASSGTYPEQNIEGHILINKKESSHLKQDANLISTYTQNGRSNFFGTIIKCFNAFSKRKARLVNTATDVPILKECDDSKNEITKVYNEQKTHSFNNKTPDKTTIKNKLKSVNKSYIMLNSTSDIQLHNACQKSKNLCDTVTITQIKFDNNSDTEFRNATQKCYGIKHKLKSYLSTFQIRKKCKNEFGQTTPSLNVNEVKLKLQNVKKMKTTGVQYACSCMLFQNIQPKILDISDYYANDKVLYRKQSQMPRLYFTSFQRQPSRYDEEIMKRRENERCSYAQEEFAISLSDIQNYKCNENVTYNKLDFAEDELIYKTIKAAIKRQILKKERDKLQISNINNRRHFNPNRRQRLAFNSFSQRFYAMNVHKLKPYECEPGVCVPNVDECDPRECIKLINKRLKKGVSTATTSDTKTVSSPSPEKPKKHRQAYHPPPRRRSTRVSAHGREHVPKGVMYTKHAAPPKPPTKKQAVHVGSSFSLNVEFSKGKSGGAAAKPKAPEADRYREERSRKSSTPKKAVGLTADHKLKDSGTSTTDTKKPGKLKRCFCTLKLQKKGNRDDRNHQVKATKDGHEKNSNTSTATSAQKTKRHSATRKKPHHHLDPHECEPNVCIPGSCDPHECLKRKKFRDQGFSAEPVPHHTSSSGTSPEKPKRKLAGEGRARGKSADSARERHKSNVSPQKQAVKIGSTFSFSLEFYKNLAPPVVETEPDEEEIILKKQPHRPRQKIKGRKVGRTSSGTSFVTEYGVDRGSGTRVRHRRRRPRGDLYGLHDQGVESRLGPRSESRGTETLRRCFCTLKLHKHGKVPAGQVKVVKHHGTTSDKYNEEPDFYSKGANTGKLLPYECEPGTCIPGQCNPYECDKRIQARYCRETGTGTGKYRPRSHSTATVYKHAQHGTKGPKYHRPSRGFGYHPVNRDVSQSIETVVEEPRFRPIMRKTRQAVRLGSDFKFNIEFFKDKTEHTKECIPRPSIIPQFATIGRGGGGGSGKRTSTTSRRSFVKRTRPKKTPKPPKHECKCFVDDCKCPIVKATKSQAKKKEKKKKPGKAQAKPKDKPVATSDNKHHGSTMTALKRCFCTLALKNRGQTQTVYTVFPHKHSRQYQHLTKTCMSKSKSGWSGDSMLGRSYQHCDNTEKLLKEILDQPQWPFSYEKYSISQNSLNELPYVMSQVFSEDFSLSKNKWSSITGFKPFFKRSVCAMRVNADTCGPKVCKAERPTCKLQECSKKKTDKKEATKSPVLKPGISKQSTTTKQLRTSRVKVRGRNVEEKAKGKDNQPKPYGGQSTIVEERRFKSINDPFRQAVRITSSFTLNLEFRRDRLPDQLKLPYEDYADEKVRPSQRARQGISIQTRRHRPHATEKSIGVGAGQVGRCPCSSKLQKLGMDVIEMKNKNIYVDFPVEPTMTDAGVGTKEKYKAPEGCDPTCNPYYCSCQKEKKKKLKNRLNKRESVQLGSKISCNVEFFKDHTYSIRPNQKGKGLAKPPTSRRNDDTVSTKDNKSVKSYKLSPLPKKKVGSPSIKTKESGVGPLLKRCFCTLKFQKQIVNFLSVDLKSPLKLEHYNDAKKCLEKSRHSLTLGSKSKPLDRMSHHVLYQDRFHRNNTKKHISQTEMETIYPYIPNKFNKSSKVLLRMRQNKRKHHNKDRTKRREKDCKRQRKSNNRETVNANQKSFFGFSKILHLQKIFRSLTHLFLKKPPQKKRKAVKPCAHARNRHVNKTEKRKQRKVSSTNIMRFSKKEHRTRGNQIKNTKEILKVSKSDRRPVTLKDSNRPKKSKSSRPTISRLNKISKKEKKKKKYTRYQTGDANESNIVSLHSLELVKRLDIKKKYLNPYMDDKLVYLSLVKQAPGGDKVENEKPILENEQYQLDEPRYKKMQPMFDMHLKAGDMSLLNSDQIHDKVLQLKRLKKQDNRNTLKIMTQLHGESCCCCVCKAVRKQAEEEEKQAEIEKNENSKYMKGKTCTCKSKTCEKEFKQKLAAKQLEAASKGKDKICVCGTKICKKESLKRSHMTKKEREKYKSQLYAEKQKHDELSRRKILAELAKEAKLAQEKQKKADKLAEKNLKKLRKANNIVLCTDAFIDVFKYAALSVFDAVRCVYKSILDPKRAYYKLRYPKQSGSLTKLPPPSLKAFGSRMKTRIGYSPHCKKTYECLESNEFTASLLTAYDGKKRKPKPKRQSEDIQRHGNFGCSLFMGSLRKKPFLKVYYTCPWFYPHFINLLKLARNTGELLLFVLAVFVWSPCILLLELFRAVMCCTMCTG